MAAKYRVVVYDQRGTGATALRCPELQEEMGASDLFPPSAAAVRHCAAWLGGKRSLFGTDDVVADMELLRRALQADRWTLDGISYGTYVGERYALAPPRRVKRLVLDSVVPHVATSALVPLELRETARVLRAACRGALRPARCAGDLAAVVHRRHDGAKILDALTLLSIVDPTTTRSSTSSPHSTRPPRATWASWTSSLATVRRWEEAPPEALSQGLHASALCADWRFPWGSSSAPLAGRVGCAGPLPRRAEDEGRLAVRRRDRGRERDRAAVPAVAADAADAAPPAARLPNVPTLLLAGDRDLSTPLAWARREAALAPNGRLVVVPGAGHSIQSRAVSDVGRRAVAKFLTSPSSA